MHLPDLQLAYFLQSLARSIGHSFWQAGIFWLFYQLVVRTDRKLPASIKYNTSIAFVFASFSWFAITLCDTYRLLSNGELPYKLYHIEAVILNFKLINNALPYISMVYLLLLFYYIFMFYRKCAHNRLLIKNGLQKAPIDIRLFTTKVAFQLGIKKKVQVWLSDNVDVPSVTGFIRPIILLPMAITNQLTMQQTEAILLHELAHVRRNDYLINLLQSAVQIVLFFNPFVISLAKTAKKERENCCDDYVINFQYNRFEYANALICLEEHRQLDLINFAMSATNGKKDLLQRVKRLFIIQTASPLNAFQKLKFVAAGIILLVAIFISFIISAEQKAKSESTNLSKVIVSPAKFLPNIPIEILYKTNITSTHPGDFLKKEKPLTAKKAFTEPALAEAKNDYVDAFINEDLFDSEGMTEAIPSLVVEKVMSDSNYIVKVEEQQSGKKRTSVYYFELKNSEGKTTINPLIILNKSTHRYSIAPRNSLKDSLQDSSNKAVKRKRVTS